MSTVGDVIENPVTGEREMVGIGTEQTDGELLVVDLYIWPGGAVIREHRHPAIQEEDAQDYSKFKANNRKLLRIDCRGHCSDGELQFDSIPREGVCCEHRRFAGI